MKDGGQAFLRTYSGTGVLGMSLRDWFAGMALTSMDPHGRTVTFVALHAYEIADAMLKEREK